MNLAANGPLMLVGILFLADVAPVGSCGCDSDPAPHPTRLAFAASDCSCAPSRITVKIDGVEGGAFECATSGYYYEFVSPGAHQVSATSADGTWATRTVIAESRTDTSVILECPTK